MQFKKAFFTELSVSTGKNLIDYIYKVPYETPKEINIYKISLMIYELSSGWAPELENISSKILKAITDTIILHIHLVFNACFKIGYCLYYFKKSVIVVLHKYNKDDYIKAKSYYPIILLNTFGKVLEAILAKCLGYLASKYILLPYRHMGG